MEDEKLKWNETTVRTGGVTEARNGPVCLLRESKRIGGEKPIGGWKPDSPNPCRN